MSDALDPMPRSVEPAESTAAPAESARLSLTGRIALLSSILFGGFVALFVYVMMPNQPEGATPVAILTIAAMAIYLGLVMGIYFAAAVCINPESTG